MALAEHLTERRASFHRVQIWHFDYILILYLVKIPKFPINVVLVLYSTPNNYLVHFSAGISPKKDSFLLPIFNIFVYKATLHHIFIFFISRYSFSFRTESGWLNQRKILQARRHVVSESSDRNQLHLTLQIANDKPWKLRF